LIVDIHAHLVAPQSLYGWRANLLATRGYYHDSPDLSDDVLREHAASNVAIIDNVGTDFQILSPRPFQQMHSAEPSKIVHSWIAANNDAIAKTVEFFPDRFAGMAGLPICAGRPVEEAFDELDRAVNDLGFVGVLLNPDPYEGKPNDVTLGDRYWYPLWEKLIEYELPALIHPAGCYSGRESYSEHFVTEESIAVLSALRSPLFQDFPDLRLIVSHGGGSVPYQIGRWQAARLYPTIGGSPDNERFEVALRKFSFDTLLHHPLSLELLIKTVGPDRCMFGTENPGSGSTTNPDTGRAYDDIKPVIEGMDFLSDTEKTAIFEGNAVAAFPRLKLPTAGASEVLVGGAVAR
jgi:predicted TIM-barrel fold metal-dependent hydrolase